MKPEPLKDKDFETDCEDGLHCFHYDDVKSAVELLKQKMLNLFGYQTGGTMGEINSVIDETFEDVVKKE